MSDVHGVNFTRGTPETVLPPLDAAVAQALEAASVVPAAEKRAALAAVAAAYPRCLDAWAGLAELAEGEVERYAYARVGYHRGLDALRAAGWRGSGSVRWAHLENRGFLRSLEQLRAAAGAMGEDDEEQRCALFLRQLDPDWLRRLDD
jgi:hypothetical protein